MRSIINLVLLLSFAMSLLFVSDAQAIGLAVDPGEINIKDVPLGKKVAVSTLGGERMKLRIENKGGSAYAYTINILSTLETTAALLEGYIDIPDTSWIWPEKKEVKIAGNSVKEVELYLKIPKKRKYYNKKYQAIIEVKSKKNRPEELFVLACQLRICFSTYAGEKEQQRDEYPRSITIIKTKDKWTEDPSFLSWLKSEFPKSSIKKVDYSTKKGKRLVDKLNIDFLPACILSKDIEKNKRFTYLSKSNLIPEGNYYLWSSAKRTGTFIKRKRRPHTLEVFCMSQCPFSSKALNSIIGAKKVGRLDKSLKLDCHYIATLVKPCKPCGEEAEMLKFRSLHGQPEVEEDIRQLCIKKYYPEEFLDYLLLRNKDIRSVDWETKAVEAGIDVEAIKKCILNKEGEELLREDIKKAEELNITTSPTFLYENRILIMDFELLKELPGLEKLEINRGGGSRSGSN